MVSFTALPLYPTAQEAGCAPEPVGTAWRGKKSCICRDLNSDPSAGESVTSCYISGKYCLHLQRRRVSHSSNQQEQSAGRDMEAVRSAETLLNLYQTVRCHIPENGTLEVTKSSGFRKTEIFLNG
jgi:hypothetical protein